MRPLLSTVLPMLLAVVSSVGLAACFDFGATMGVPLVADAASLETGGGGLDAGGASDARAESNDGGLDATWPTHDGGLDGNSAQSDAEGEGGTTHDAGVTAKPDAATYCASAATTIDASMFVCDDFDEDSLPGSWSQFATTGGTIAETDASAVSLPNSLEVVAQPSDGGTTVDIALRRSNLPVPSLPTVLSLSWEIEPVQLDSAPNATTVLTTIDFIDTAGNRYSVIVSVVVQAGAAILELGEQTGLVDGGAAWVPHPFVPQQQLTAGAWVPVVVQINWTGPTTATVSATVRGTTVLDTTLGLTVQAAWLQLGIGTTYVVANNGWDFRYDNILFTAE